jgi:RAB protein geranylgeranyltransferase component A
MDEEHLPEDQYEVVVVGTGLVECIVAGAAARLSKKVVHLDPNDFYGEDWASFQLQDLVKYVRSSRAAATKDATATAPDSGDLSALQTVLAEVVPRFSNVEEWRVPEIGAPTEAELLLEIRRELSLAADLSPEDTVSAFS